MNSETLEYHGHSEGKKLLAAITENMLTLAKDYAKETPDPSSRLMRWFFRQRLVVILVDFITDIRQAWERGTQGYAKEDIDELGAHTCLFLVAIVEKARTEYGANIAEDIGITEHEWNENLLRVENGLRRFASTMLFADPSALDEEEIEFVYDELNIAMRTLAGHLATW